MSANKGSPDASSASASHTRGQGARYGRSEEDRTHCGAAKMFMMAVLAEDEAGSVFQRSRV